MAGTDTGEPTADSAGEPTRAISHIEEHAEAIRTEQVERAVSRLANREDLTDEQQAAVEALSERLVERLLATPRQSLRAAERGDDTAATAVALFNRESGR